MESGSPLGSICAAHTKTRAVKLGSVPRVQLSRGTAEKFETIGRGASRAYSCFELVTLVSNERRTRNVLQSIPPHANQRATCERLRVHKR
jgi:hypothetical protein